MQAQCGDVHVVDTSTKACEVPQGVSFKTCLVSSFQMNEALNAIKILREGALLFLVFFDAFLLFSGMF